MERPRIFPLIALAILHPVLWCGLSGLALVLLYSAVGEGHPLFEHTVLQALFGCVFSFPIVAAAPLVVILFRRRGAERAGEAFHLFSIVLRFFTEDPQEAARRLREAIAGNDPLVGTMEEWTLVVRPLLPPARDLEGPKWDLLQTDLSDPYPQFPRVFDGAIAFQAEEGALRTVLFVVRPRVPLLNPVLRARALRQMRWAARRLAGVIRPASAPILPEEPFDDSDVPPELRSLWDFARRVLATLRPRRMDPDRFRAAAPAVAGMAYLSALAGTLAVGVGGLRPEFGLCVGIFSAAGPAISWGAYRVAFWRRMEMHEALFGPQPVEHAPGSDLEVIGKAILVFLGVAVGAPWAFHASGVNAWSPDASPVVMALVLAIGPMIYVAGMGLWGYLKGEREADGIFRQTGAPDGTG